jgi:L-alanine-DL-glutamate epimerase-like enolase superfamily enzyme
MTRIVEVQARTVRVPLEAATAFSNRLVHDRFYTLVRVTGDDGVTGTGFCYGGHKGGEVVTSAVRRLLADVVVGQDAHRVEGIWQDAYAEVLLHGRAGAVLRGLSAVDIALWDRNARAADLPLFKLLGNAVEGRVPAYASGGYYLDGKGPEQLADEMRAHVDAGFSAVKMKIGRLHAGEDEQRLAAVREAVGPDVEIMLDANNAWQDLPTALGAMARWEVHRPYWIEEPFSPDDIENHARLAERISIPVATGEIEAGRWRHKHLLDERAATILQTDAAVCGGITEFRRIAAIASGYGVTLCPHWFHDLHVHLVAATPNATYVEYFPDDAVLNFRRLLDTQLVVEAGQLLLPDRPGLGFGLDDDAVERYAADDWA